MSGDELIEDRGPAAEVDEPGHDGAIRPSGDAGG
jgi:hypothetical protein